MLAFVAISAFFAERLLQPPRRSLRTDPAPYLAKFETVAFRARDGVPLAGWFAPCAGATEAVVLLHGYGSDRTQMLGRAAFFHASGFAVLLYDARGHGTSGNTPVSFGWFETQDLLGALDWLRARGFETGGCVGASQGGATIALAATGLRHLKWVILESVYPTLENAVDRRFRRTVGLPGWLAGAAMIPIAEWRLGIHAQDVNPRDAAAHFSCPVLVMSGDLDTHTRPADARELFDRVPTPKTFHLVPGAAHVDLYAFAPARYECAVQEFLAANAAGKPASQIPLRLPSTK